MRFWVVLWFVLLAPAAHASTFSLDTYDQTVKADSPELYWRLGEQTGTAVADASGHAHARDLRVARRGTAPARARWPPTATPPRPTAASGTTRAMT